MQMRKPIRYFVYPMLDIALQLNARRLFTSYDPARTVVVSSSPRGGSTFLAEMIAVPGRRLVIWEPLHLLNNPGARQHGFNWVNHIDASDWLPETDPRRRYVERLVTGRVVSTATTSRNSLRGAELLRNEGLLVKFVNASMMISWVAETFPCTCVHLVRHPCAVVYSQIRHGGFEHIDRSSFSVSERFLDEVPEARRQYDSISTNLEFLAFGWAMQNWYPVHRPSPALRCVTYEDLAGQPAAIEALLRELGIDVPADLKGLVLRDSASTQADHRGQSVRARIEKWRTGLDRDAQSAILSITRSMGFEHEGG